MGKGFGKDARKMANLRMLNTRSDQGPFTSQPHAQVRIRHLKSRVCCSTGDKPLPRRLRQASRGSDTSSAFESPNIVNFGLSLLKIADKYSLSDLSEHALSPLQIASS